MPDPTFRFLLPTKTSPNSLPLYCPPASFGELALLYDAPRQASVIAAQDSKVWVVTRSVFKRNLSSLRDAKVQENLELINQVETLQCLLSDEKQKMAEWLVKLHFPKVWINDARSCGGAQPLRIFQVEGLRTSSHEDYLTVCCPT